MAGDADRWWTRLGNAAFLLMMPGYFVYHSLVGRGWIPGFLGGYSTGIALVLLAPLSVAYARTVLQGGWRIPRVDAAFLGFSAFLAAAVVAHLGLGANREIATPHLGIAFQFVSLFLAVRMLDLESKGFRKALVVSYVGVTALVVWNASDQSLVAMTLELSFSDARIADYQGYAFVYLVLVIFVASGLRSGLARAASYLVAVPALFVNGARSEFIGLFLAILVIEYCRTTRRTALASALVALLAVGALGSGPLRAQVEVLFPESRVAALVSVATDDSASERIRFLQNAWRTIGEHPLLGSFGSYPVGEYAHNALSAWVDLGFVGFVYYVVLLLVPVVALARRFRTEAGDPQFVLALASAVVLLGLSLVAKNFSYQLFPITLALFARWDARPGDEPSLETSPA